MSDAVTIHDNCPACTTRSLKPHCSNRRACDLLACGNCSWLGTRDGKRSSTTTEGGTS